MTPFDTHKMKVAGVACLVICALVTLLGHMPAVAEFLTIAPAHTQGQKQVNAGAQNAAASLSTDASSSPELVNINTAGEEQLTTLKGIGASKATAVIAYRNAHGPFYSADDLTKVPGIGPVMLKLIMNQITVGDVGAPPAGVAIKTAAAAHPRKTPPAIAISSAAPDDVPQAHIVISHVMAGGRGDAADAFVELYNAGTEPVNLTGWSVKKQSTRGVSPLVAAARFKGKQILPGKHFLLAGSGYHGDPPPDIIWPASYSVPRENGEVLLYNSAGMLADSLAWDSIAPGQSYGRPDGAPTTTQLRI